jgi:DNA-binding transcriptional regulator YiaG
MLDNLRKLRIMGLMDKTEIKSIRKLYGSVRDFAYEVGVSPRTEEGWEQGYPIPMPTQILIKALEEIKLNDCNNTDDHGRL